MSGRNPVGGGPGQGTSGGKGDMYELESDLLYTLALENQPEGFRTTFINDDRLGAIQDAHRKLRNDSAANNLNQTVVDFGDFQLTERDIIDRELAKAQKAYETNNRAVELPGVKLNRDAIYAIAAQFKESKDLGPIVPPSLAEPGQNQAVFEFATPEVFNDLANAQTGVSGVNANNFFRGGNLSAGNTLNLVSDGGVAGPQGNTAHLELARDDDELILTGDVVDPLGDVELSKFEYVNIDGNDDLGPDSTLFQSVASTLGVYTFQGNYVKTRVDLDSKVYDGGETGEAHPIPVAFRLGQADNAQTLV